MKTVSSLPLIPTPGQSIEEYLRKFCAPVGTVSPPFYYKTSNTNFSDLCWIQSVMLFRLKDHKTKICSSVLIPLELFQRAITHILESNQPFESIFNPLDYFLPFCLNQFYHSERFKHFSQLYIQIWPISFYSIWLQTLRKQQNRTNLLHKQERVIQVRKWPIAFE